MARSSSFSPLLVFGFSVGFGRSCRWWRSSGEVLGGRTVSGRWLGGVPGVPGAGWWPGSRLVADCLCLVWPEEEEEEEEQEEERESSRLVVDYFCVVWSESSWLGAGGWFHPTWAPRGSGEVSEFFLGTF